MNPIVLEAQSNIAPENRGVRSQPGGSWFSRKVEWAAEGLTVTPTSFESKEGETHTFDEVELTSEMAPVRGFSFADLRKGLVAAIGGQNYMIRIEVEDDGDGTPTGATVCFIPTTMPETPWTPFNEEEAKAEYIARLRLDNEQMLAEVEDAEWNKEFIERNLRTITEVESGQRRLKPPGEVLLFGKPQWIQNPIFPAFEGKAAVCLAVLETGWGDCGNINLLFTQDAEGRPNNVWFEASCC